MPFYDQEWDEDVARAERLRLALSFLLVVETAHTFFLDGSIIVLLMRSVWLLLLFRNPRRLTHARWSPHTTMFLNAFIFIYHIGAPPTKHSSWDFVSDSQATPASVVHILLQDLIVSSLQYAYLVSQHDRENNLIHVL
eukprot:TRINITY_DN5306_c0_g2_i1.p1 TRINITY_DN5306_c0_g2~~TRINITY_DN5306_c0_g2_i1.p1  ORF type:complete len:138 (-),score=24.47 TRINITY_DN5306_c0_g2_i1:353-766(-)